jgi:hypothetical protein
MHWQLVHCHVTASCTMLLRGSVLVFEVPGQRPVPAIWVDAPVRANSSCCVHHSKFASVITWTFHALVHIYDVADHCVGACNRSSETTFKLLLAGVCHPAKERGRWHDDLRASQVALSRSPRKPRHMCISIQDASQVTNKDEFCIRHLCAHWNSITTPNPT